MKKTVKVNEEISTKEYWQQHINECNKNGQNKSAYCRAYQLDYDQMIYWVKRLKKEKEVSFIPIKANLDRQAHENDGCICILAMSSGHLLKIYDERALTIILNKWN